MTRFTRLLIANRGEIACRVIATARRLGYETVAVHSAADADARHVRLADLAVEIGPAPVGQSYLSIPRLIDAARRTGADAVHPGYGFLSENADFAQACRDAGLVFVGPSPEAIRAMGSKRLAKERVAAAGVPVLPGYSGAAQDEETLLREAERVGLPLMVKASAGGGGRGLRLVTDAADLPGQIARARAEAQSSFGDGELILERALIEPRHVEIQVFGDRFGTLVHLGERDCSVQRRHQKVVEEAPSPAVTPEIRAAMGEAAVKAARAVDYVGAGTVEFLLDRDGGFYFMEMNTRLQVEHPVTEMVTGFDLVEWQLRVAAGEPLPTTQDRIGLNGHAIEVRLYAEDPYHGFLPQTGTVRSWRPPADEGVRVDHGIAVGGEVTSFYDPMLAKLIAHGRDREEARRRLLRALDRTVLHGVTTNRSFLRQILAHPDFAEGRATTGMLAGMALAPPQPAPAARALAAVMLADADGPEPWHSHGGAVFRLRLAWPGGEELVEIVPGGDGMSVSLGDSVHAVRVLGMADGVASVVLDGIRRAIPATRDGQCLLLDLDGATFAFEEAPLTKTAGRGAGAGGDRVTAPMPGTVVEVAVEPGQAVAKGQKLLVLEAMKMQLELKAPADGTVEEVRARPGEQVAARSLLVKLALA
ncbi:acetyl/propionyl/methylcrotonyl-CoA carboxylase subunit alpha [Rhodocista pekingensis]|uniref:Acetyl/propionyl/methylcrotonyl-CoA carboxylase subunit alpha n=1 Tax=Rhodocista pekingensis TaxID=201185 RepID=A0ABW2KVB4_9PROT